MIVAIDAHDHVVAHVGPLDTITDANDHRVVKHIISRFRLDLEARRTCYYCINTDKGKWFYEIKSPDATLKDETVINWAQWHIVAYSLENI